ncbi:MAG: tRNA 2-thiouridine(34) synthase MnmA, partial [Desulfuromonas sp.]
DIDAAKKQVVVGEKEYLSRRELTVVTPNWLISVPQEPFRAACRIRYRHHEAAATLTPLANGRITVDFDEAQLGVTPGQSVVFYAADRVLGGGVIA